MATKFQMQGRNTVTQQIVTWLATKADWLGEQSPVPVADVALFVSSRFAPDTAIPIVCRFASPLTSERPMAGVGFLITGVITRPGAVSIAGLGPATVTGLTWFLLWVPGDVDAGSCTLTATATDANNGTTSTVSVTFTVVAAASFPAIAAPSAWYDGRQQAYSDAGATVQVNAPVGIVQRVNEPSPLTGNWAAPSVDERPIRDAAAIRLECQGPAGGYRMVRSDPGVVYRDACTVVVAYVPRDNAFAGPLMGLLQDSTQYAGFRIGSNQPFPNTSAGLFASGLILAPGKLNVLAVTYTPTSVTVKLDADGVVTTVSTSVTTAHVLLGSWNLGVDGATYMYGSVTQAMVFASALSGADRDAAMSFAKLTPPPQAYPDTEVLLAWVGDSITRSTATSYDKCFASLSLAAVRSAGYRAENYNGAVGGTGVNRLIDPINGALPPNSNNLFQRASAFYSATRIANVMVIALGTNNLAAGDNSAEFVLHGTGSPNDAGGTTPFPGSGLYPAIDAAVAQGWKVVVVVPGPRSDNPSYQATYNAKRAAVCDDLVANGHTHGAIVVDTRGIVHWGVDGDSDDPTYYSTDKIHPINAGHAIVAPAITAAILAALAA